MRIILIGAGELGHLVAAKLCSLKHDVVIVDTRPESLEHAGEELDTQLLVGAGTSVETLKKAGAQEADLLLALSGNEAANILACTMAKRLGTRQTICRVLSRDAFSEKDGITPLSFLIDHIFSPVDECVKMIHDILQNQILLHQITFENPDALVDVVNVPLNSSLVGVPLRDLPRKDLLKTIRLAAIIRKRELVIPNGETILKPGDKLYVAGRVQDVNAFVEWLSKDGSRPVRRVLVAGLSPVGERLTRKLLSEGIEVRIVEENPSRAEHFLENLHKDVMVIQGETTNMDVLSEAGVEGCDAFAALSSRDENNILACLLASRMGAKRVITLTSTAEYMDILPSIQEAGCWFNTTQIAANAAFRLMHQGTIRVDPELRAINAKLLEFTLPQKSRFVGKSIQECKTPPGFLIALVLRENEVIAPTGQTVLQDGDQLIVIANSELVQKIREHLQP